jgi:hypothetical protein
MRGPGLTSKNIRRHTTALRVAASSIRRIASWFAAGGSLRITVAVLLLAYAGLAGEAIHCQYFPAAHNEHSEHSTAPVPATDHATHCLVASHAGSVIIDTNGAAPLEALAPTPSILPDEGIFLLSHLLRLTPARAPPLS